MKVKLINRPFHRRFKRRSTVQQKPTLSRTVVSSTEKRPRLSSGRDVPTGFSGSKISIIENAQPRHFGMADQFHSAKISDPRSSSSDAASNTSQPVLRSILKKNGIYRQYSSPGELNYCNN
ncbi:hypothetical protein Ddc_16899 [Ditylenchus destructor]|nr:hypothetical protein Ddc_16899 [Ditylenchus destructor]